MKLQDVVRQYPRLYHMAERGSWRRISEVGLLSTSAALDRVGLSGDERARLEACHRPEKVVIGVGAESIVLRDQKPMAPLRLREALVDGTTPEDWYKLLNSKVFMWAQEHRLIGLLSARNYRNDEHDVLVLDAAPLLEAYEESVWLCHMNSGNTFPVPHPRGKEIFKRIADYPTRAGSQVPLKEVVEVVVDYAIPDVARFVVEVRRMRAGAVLEIIG